MLLASLRDVNSEAATYFRILKRSIRNCEKLQVSGRTLRERIIEPAGRSRTRVKSRESCKTGKKRRRKKKSDLGRFMVIIHHTTR